MSVNIHFFQESLKLSSSDLRRLRVCLSPDFEIALPHMAYENMSLCIKLFHGSFTCSNNVKSHLPFLPECNDLLLLGHRSHILHNLSVYFKGGAKLLFPL